MNSPEDGMSLQPGNRAATPRASSATAVAGGRTHLGTDEFIICFACAASRGMARFFVWRHTAPARRPRNGRSNSKRRNDLRRWTSWRTWLSSPKKDRVQPCGKPWSTVTEIWSAFARRIATNSVWAWNESSWAGACRPRISRKSLGATIRKTDRISGFVLLPFPAPPAETRPACIEPSASDEARLADAPGPLDR